MPRLGGYGWGPLARFEKDLFVQNTNLLLEICGKFNPDTKYENSTKIWYKKITQKDHTKRWHKKMTEQVSVNKIVFRTYLQNVNYHSPYYIPKHISVPYSDHCGGLIFIFRTCVCLRELLNLS